MSEQVEEKRQQLRQLLFKGQRIPWFEAGMNELITAVHLAASARPEAAQQEHAHTWTCGCGWRNGVNLAVCACCGRSPGGDNPCVQDEDCIHGQQLAAAESSRLTLRAQIEQLEWHLTGQYNETQWINRADVLALLPPGGEPQEPT